MANQLHMLKNIFGNTPYRGAQGHIAVGDRFEAVNQKLPVWIVERISTVASSQFPLISIRCETKPDLQKIVSQAVLEDGIAFKPIVN